MTKGPSKEGKIGKKQQQEVCHVPPPASFAGWAHFALFVDLEKYKFESVRAFSKSAFRL